MRLFISYSRKDIDTANLIASQLRHRGADVFVDYERLKGGENFPERLALEIEASDAIALLLSEYSAVSKWVRAEVQHAFHCNKLIIPIILDATEMPAAFFFLNGVENVGFTQRHTDTGLNTAISKLAEAVGLREQSVPTKPSGTPAQAVLGGRVEVANILPSPFEWCEIPSGLVELTYDNNRRKNFSIERNFFIAKYPITNAQYQAFIDAPDGYRKERNWSYSEDAQNWREAHPEPTLLTFVGSDLPRTNVTWYEAIAFCRWLSNRVGYEVRLPKEQEWQRAAQGDDKRNYPWGSNFDFSRCNIRADAITPVTKYPNGASPYGVMDMAGNICEWCLTKSGIGSVNVELTGAEHRILRGYPHYGDEYRDVSVTFRVGYAPECVNNSNGFRIAMDYVERK